MKTGGPLRRAAFAALWVVLCLAPSALAAGSIGYDEIKERFKTKEILFETLEMALDIEPAGWSDIRIGHPHPEKFVGMRLGPHRFRARQKAGERRCVEVVLLTDYVGLDKDGKHFPLPEGLDEDIETIEEWVVGIEINAAKEKEPEKPVAP